MNEQIKTPRRIKIAVKIIVGLLLMSQIYIAPAYVFNYIYWEDGIMHFQYETIQWSILELKRAS